MLGHGRLRYALSNIETTRWAKMIELVDDISEILRRWPQAERRLRGTTTRVVIDAGDLAEVYRLRHRRYVVEQGKQYVEAVGGQLIDPIDEVSLNIGHYRGGRLAAAVRLSRLGDVQAGDYLSPLRESLGRRFAPQTMICSRFVVEPGTNSLQSLISLSRVTYELGLCHGGEFSALCTRPDLAGIFEVFGYRETGASFDHPVAGVQTVMVLDMLAWDFLNSIRSPLVPVLAKFAGEVASTPPIPIKEHLQ